MIASVAVPLWPLVLVVCVAVLWPCYEITMAICDRFFDRWFERWFVARTARRFGCSEDEVRDAINNWKGD